MSRAFASVISSCGGFRAPTDPVPSLVINLILHHELARMPHEKKHFVSSFEYVVSYFYLKHVPFSNITAVSGITRARESSSVKFCYCNVAGVSVITTEKKPAVSCEESPTNGRATTLPHSTTRHRRAVYMIIGTKCTLAGTRPSVSSLKPASAENYNMSLLRIMGPMLTPTMNNKYYNLSLIHI